MIHFFVPLHNRQPMGSSSKIPRPKKGQSKGYTEPISGTWYANNLLHRHKNIQTCQKNCCSHGWSWAASFSSSFLSLFNSCAASFMFIWSNGRLENCCRKRWAWAAPLAISSGLHAVFIFLLGPSSCSCRGERNFEISCEQIDRVLGILHLNLIIARHMPLQQNIYHLVLIKPPSEGRYICSSV